MRQVLSALTAARKVLYDFFYVVGLRIGWIVQQARLVSSEDILKAIGALAAFAIAASGVAVALLANQIASQQTQIMRLEYAPVWEVVSEITPSYDSNNRSQQIHLMNYGEPVVMTGYSAIAFWSGPVYIDDQGSHFDLWIPITGFYFTHLRGSISGDEVMRSVGPLGGTANFEKAFQSVGSIESSLPSGMKAYLRLNTIVYVDYTDKAGTAHHAYYDDLDGFFKQSDPDWSETMFSCSGMAALIDMDYSLYEDEKSDAVKIIENIIQFNTPGAKLPESPIPDKMKDYGSCLAIAPSN